MLNGSVARLANVRDDIRPMGAADLAHMLGKRIERFTP